MLDRQVFALKGGERYSRPRNPAPPGESLVRISSGLVIQQSSVGQLVELPTRGVGLRFAGPRRPHQTSRTRRGTLVAPPP